ncbi:leucine-rich repeat domain-containing protein, partial [Akkermansiaceae bacterium]|nr:leucine-rich repeat domain-containing protein [Akkermansiaceae bacterium]
MKPLQALLALFACAFLPLHAASLKDLTYATTDGKISITGCDRAAKGNLVIPDTIEEKPVTKIGGGAFRDCASLTSITIPDSVEIIGDLAFAGCTNLPKIEVGEKNRKYTDVNGVLFDKKKTLLLNYPAGKPDTTYKIPDNVTSIRTYAFYRSLNLISVTIPDSVTSVTSDAFYRCTNLTNVTIGNGVTSIERAAFAGCTSMTSITIPDGVTSIGHG